MDALTLRRTTENLRQSTDSQVLAACREWTKRDRITTATLITHLAEVANRRLYLDRSPYMYAYCTEVLKIEPGCTWLRLQVANCCRKFPELLDDLADGSVSLSVAALLAPQLKPENQAELRTLVRNKTKREAEEALADRNPKPACKPEIRLHRSTEAQGANGFSFAAGEIYVSVSPLTPPTENGFAASPSSTHVEPVPRSLGEGKCEVERVTTPAKRLGKLEALGNQRYDVKFNFNSEQKSKLERFAEVMGLAVRGDNLAVLMERALDIALKAKDPQQKAVRSGSEQRAKTEESSSRYISLALKKQVLERAQFCCQHTSSDGIRCGQRNKLQIDHIVPLAWEGKTSCDNLQVLCAGHHRMKTEEQQGIWIKKA